MTPRYLGTTAAIACLIHAQPVLADITAADVWDNGAALFEALGGRQQGELLRDGSTVTVRDHGVIFDLPLGAGQISILLSSYEMIEDEDTVTIIYPGGMTVTFAASIAGEGLVSATVALQGSPITTHATGDPGAISYVTEAGPSSVTLTDLVVPGEYALNGVLQIDFEGYETETRIIEDSLLVIYSRSEIGRSISLSEFDDDFGFITTTTAENGPSTSTINMGLIPGGADILNLSAALRDGMYISGESHVEETTSQTTILLDGEVFQDQTYEATDLSASFLLDKTQLSIGADFGPGLLEFAQDFMTPPSFGIDFQGMSLDLAGPILSAVDPQPFRIGLGLEELRIGPTIWELFDPQKRLPRDPGTVELRANGALVLDADLPDLLALPELGGRQDVTAQVTGFEIERFGFSGLGVTADSSGKFELDYEDYSLFPGVPWPRGEGRAEIRGLNGLIDALIDQGAMTPQEAIGFRLMISIGTIAAGNDFLRSEIEFTEDGRVIANGQPINIP